jgi:glycosyltransferase involved in cell wall biosynthesis
MNRKKILFLLTQDLESPSGIGRYYPLSKYLVKQGFSVTIAALHSNFEKLEEYLFWKEGVKIAYVAQMHVKKDGHQTKYFNSPQLLWRSFIATWKLFLFTMKNPADFLVISKPHPMNSIAGLIGGHLLSTIILLDCDDYEAASNYFNSFWQRWIVETFENWMPKLVDHVITNTFFNQERMVKSGVPIEKIDYLPNGVDKERFIITDKNKSDQIVSKLNLDNQQVIAYIGSLSLANHPVDLLVESFKIISEKIENVKLLIVGGGKDLKALITLVGDLNIQDHVFFEGRVSPDLIPYYYQVVDVTVDPVYDTDDAKGRCPLKMFESWATGTPFVTSDVGDRAYLAGEPPSILLAEPGDSQDLAEKISSILTDPKLAKYMRHIGIERAKNYYWTNLVGNNWNSIFSSTSRKNTKAKK